METTYRLARQTELESIFSLYRSLAGRPQSTWNSEYPGWNEILEDFSKKSLYVAVKGERLVGVAALGDVDGLNVLDCWAVPKECDLARIGICAERQSKGEAKAFLRFLKEEAVARGFEGIRLIASPSNAAAVGLYKKSGFAFRGECDLYGEHWHCYEWTSAH